MTDRGGTVISTLSEEDRRTVLASVSAAVEGGRASQNDGFRAPGEDGATFVRALAAEAGAHLEGKPASRILAWAADVLPRFAVTSSFGAESVVLLHMVSRLERRVPIVFLDTGFHFAETLGYRDRLTEMLDLDVVDVQPEMTVEEQARRFGADLPHRDPDACCRMRKTLPLRRALGAMDGWATGVRRSQTPERATTPVVEARRLGNRWLTKVAPLATWSDEDVLGYLIRNDLPLHPLQAVGYRSIGCAPCTAPVAAGEDARAGRWVGTGKTECGLHLADDAPRDRLRTTPG